MQALCEDLQLAMLTWAAQAHPALQNHLIGLAQQQRAFGPALPVCTLGLNMEARLEYGGHFQRRVMLKARPGQQQFHPTLCIQEARREVGQAVVEAWIRQACNEAGAAVIRPLPAHYKHQHQGQAGRQYGASGHR